MISRFKIANLWLGAAMLFAMLFQSFHATEHLVEQFSQPHCDHHYNIGKTEVGHAHPNHETCFTCEFTFQGFTAALPTSIAQNIPFATSLQPLIGIDRAPQVFGGSMLLLRGPPCFTVS